MKLTNVTPKTQAFASFGQNENRDARTARMRAFWALPVNATIYPAGRVLAVKVDATRTIADVLCSGESIEMDSIVIDGKSLPLSEGFSMSLANLPQTWGCPACRSAHGSAIYPSRGDDNHKPQPRLLEANKFYYNPETRALFTISETCWGDYVKALGAATPKRFTSPVAVGKAPKPTPATVGK